MASARSRWQRLRRFVLIAAGVALVAPVLLVLPLNVVHPPATAFMLKRFVTRWLAGTKPAWPRRVPVPANAIAPALRRAVLAAEDDRFYLHHGFDLEEIGKALEGRRRGGRLRGASTITQQVARNLFLWEGRSFVRKGIEAYLTVVLELCLSKERLLDLYLNLAEWGDGVFGAEMAARTHFRTSARSLTSDQAALLAAVLPAPRRWSPHGAVARQRAVIIRERMRYAPPRARRNEASHGRRGG